MLLTAILILAVIALAVIVIKLLIKFDSMTEKEKQTTEELKQVKVQHEALCKFCVAVNEDIKTLELNTSDQREVISGLVETVRGIVLLKDLSEPKEEPPAEDPATTQEKKYIPYPEPYYTKKPSGNYSDTSIDSSFEEKAYDPEEQ
ncbi:hypothetical protein OQJ65_17090 [Vibrio sp. Sgm 22]|uniref:hypothetical protein n=1 Tax=unclassified Vibrio TaxID=2614977 RepID=UPI0022491A92|nr:MULTISPECIES: hypothetical protein [unclassified Vibrio]MCX2760051.1 hypothetical protein [Vibrio sp. 14G-20]MCX2777039.1 hypothetical protein [Vibrio sp. Sgm 22]